MAAVTLVLGAEATRDTLPAVGNVRRVVMPDTPNVWLRFQSSADVYLLLSDETDDSAIGTEYETFPSGSAHEVYIGRGECALSATEASQVVSLRAIEQRA